VAAAGDRQRVMARSLVSESRLRGGAVFARRWRRRSQCRSHGRALARTRLRCDPSRAARLRGGASKLHRADHRRRPAQVFYRL